MVAVDLYTGAMGQGHQDGQQEYAPRRDNEAPPAAFDNVGKIS